MALSYDDFFGAFLGKISDYDLVSMTDEDITSTLDSYLKRAVSAFKKNCLVDLFTTADDEAREFRVDVKAEDKDELVDIISQGMIVQWLQPYYYKQELLENVLNTRDFTTYSPAEMLLRVGNAYKEARREYAQMIRDYSYNHGDLGRLHL